MHPQIGNGADSTSIHQIVEDLLGERIEALASWIQELDAQVRATSAAGDEKTLKELRKALEAWTKRDPKFEERLTERVDVLADRLATLSSTVNTTAAARASSEGEIAGLRRELEQETVKLHAALRELGVADVSRDLQELRRTVAELGRTRGRTEGESGASREEIENLAVRVDMLAKTVQTTAAGLAGREGDLASLRRALEETDARISQLAASVPRTSEASNVARLEAGLAELAQRVAATTDALTERERVAASVRARVEEQGTKLEAFASAVRESMQALQARLAEVAGKDDGAAAVAVLDTRVASLAERLDAGDPRFEELRTRLESVSSQLADFMDERSGSAEEIASLRRQVDESGVRFDAAVAELRELLEAVPTGPSLADLETRLAPLQDQLDGFVAKLDESGTQFEVALQEVRRVVDALPAAPALADVDAMLAPLRAQVEGLVARAEESETRFEGALADLRRLVDELPLEPSLGDLDARLAPLETQLEGLAATIVDAEGRTTEWLERETSRASRLEQRLEGVSARLEEVAQRQESAATEAEATKSTSELERAWVREQMDAIVSAVADTAARADVESIESLVNGLAQRIETLASDQASLTAEIGRTREAMLAETERLDAQLRELPEPSLARPDLEPFVSDLTRRVQELAAEQSERTAKAASAHEAFRSEIERLDAQLRELPEPSPAQPDLGPLVTQLTRRVEQLSDEQSTRSAEVASAHGALRSQIERLEAELEDLPEVSAPIPPSEDEQLKHLLTAFADRIDAMERERATIADEAAAVAQSRVDQVRPLVEGLRRRLDESERRLEARGPTEALTVTLEELAARMQALEERPVAPPQPAPLPGDGRFRVELRALELRMQHAEAAARENREAVLVQLERLASRVEWRLQRLESGEQTGPEGAQEEQSLGQVVPLRGGAET